MNECFDFGYLFIYLIMFLKKNILGILVNVFTHFDWSLL